MKNTSRLLAAVALGALTCSASAHAAGFFIQEQSVSAGGAAYAGAASHTRDASTLFFNPSGMTKLSGAQGNLGVQLLLPSASLDNTGSTFLGSTTYSGSTNDGGNPYNPTPVPSGYIVTPISAIDGLWVGLGVTAPFGLRNKYDPNYFARYDSYKTKLETMDIQPSVAYKVNDWLSLGGSINAQKADAELDSAAFITAAGISKLKGDDWGYGYSLGAQVDVMPGTTVGINYRSSIHYLLDGTVTLEGTSGVGSRTVIPAVAALTTPDIASIGASHALDDKWTLMGQANWYGWNNFDNITARNKATGSAVSRVNQDYQAVWSYAVGAEYAYSPEWTFRGGVQFDNTPTVDRSRTTRTPDGDRTWLSGGATYKINDKMSLDMNLTYIDIADQEISVSRNSGVAVVRADTSGSVGIAGVGFNYKF